MACLFSDENFPLPVIEELRRLGHDVLTIQEAGKANQRLPDKAVLEFASEDGRAVLTINRKHFVRLHALSSDHAGIIACTVDIDFVGQAHRIHQAIESQDNLNAMLIRINLQYKYPCRISRHRRDRPVDQDSGRRPQALLVKFISRSLALMN